MDLKTIVRANATPESVKRALYLEGIISDTMMQHLRELVDRVRALSPSLRHSCVWPLTRVAVIHDTYHGDEDLSLLQNYVES